MITYFGAFDTLLKIKKSKAQNHLWKTRGFITSKVNAIDASFNIQVLIQSGSTTCRFCKINDEIYGLLEL